MVGAVIGAGIGAVGSIASASMQSSAASKAADQAKQAADEAARLQQERFNTTRNDLLPFTQTGVNASNRLSRIFGLGGDPGAPYPGQFGTASSMPTYGQPPAPGPGQNPRGAMPVPPTPPQAGGGFGATYSPQGGNFATGGALPQGWQLAAVQGAGGENGSSMPGNQWMLIDDKGALRSTFAGNGIESQAQQWLQENNIPGAGTAGGGGFGISPQAQSQYAQQLADYQAALAAYNTPNSLTPIQQAGLYAPLPGYGSSVTPYGAPNNGIFTFDQSNLQNAPGFQFQLDQAKRAADASAAARGGLQSGAALKAAVAFGNNLATTNWQNQLAAQKDIFGTNLNSSIALNNQYYDKNINPLFDLAKMGANTGAMTGQIGNSSAATQGAFVNSGGQSQAAATIGGANAIANGIGSAAKTIGNWVGSTYGKGPADTGGTWDTGSWQGVGTPADMSGQTWGAGGWQ